MKFIAIVSGDDVILGAEELKQLSGAKKYSIKGQVTEFEGKEFDYSRLAYTHKLCELLFVTIKKNLEKDVKDFNWDKPYSGSFRVDTFNLGMDLGELGSMVWDQLKKPKVSLKKPKTQIYFIGSGSKVFVCKLLFGNTEKFGERRPHLRPGFHPSSLQPKLARALINLANVKEGGVITDPFCGTGGILIEAGLLGYKLVGSDVSEGMVELCKENFKFFKFKGYKVFEADATKVEIKANAVITDPPYGICSSLRKADKKELYRAFLDNVYKQLKKGSRVVIMFPNNNGLKGKFKLIAKIPHYMHHSLTRQIFVLEK